MFFEEFQISNLSSAKSFSEVSSDKTSPLNNVKVDFRQCLIKTRSMNELRINKICFKKHQMFNRKIFEAMNIY